MTELVLCLEHKDLRDIDRNRNNEEEEEKEEAL